MSHDLEQAPYVMSGTAEFIAVEKKYRADPDALIVPFASPATLVMVTRTLGKTRSYLFPYTHQKDPIRLFWEAKKVSRVRRGYSMLVSVGSFSEYGYQCCAQPALRMHAQFSRMIRGFWTLSLTILSLR